MPSISYFCPRAFSHCRCKKSEFHRQKSELSKSRKSVGANREIETLRLINLSVTDVPAFDVVGQSVGTSVYVLVIVRCASTLRYQMHVRNFCERTQCVGD